MKDNENLLDYNVWSGTDYNNTITGFYPIGNALIQSTNEFSNIGEYSYKIIRTNDDVSRVLGLAINNLTEPTNLTITLTVYNPNNNIAFNFNDGEIISSIIIPSSSTPKRISLTAETTKNKIDFVGVLNNKQYLTYIDNIKIKINQ